MGAVNGDVEKERTAGWVKAMLRVNHVGFSVVETLHLS